MDSCQWLDFRERSEQVHLNHLKFTYFKAASVYYSTRITYIKSMLSLQRAFFKDLAGLIRCPWVLSSYHGSDSSWNGPGGTQRSRGTERESTSRMTSTQASSVVVLTSLHTISTFSIPGVRDNLCWTSIDSGPPDGSKTISERGKTNGCCDVGSILGACGRRSGANRTTNGLWTRGKKTSLHFDPLKEATTWRGLRSKRVLIQSNRKFQ